MSRIGRPRSKSAEEIDVDMVPIMNMFLVLIPFLLMSASFLHMKAINTSVPVLAGDHNSANDIKVTVVVEIGKNSIDLSIIPDSQGYEELSKWGTRIPKREQEYYPLNKMAVYLQKIKEAYPVSDTLIIIPDESVIYETIIQTMDVARYSSEDIPLFPNVVLSGKVGL